MKPVETVTTLLAFCVLPAIAAANVIVRFDEGAPKDRFTVENSGACDLGPATVNIDLSESAGGLYFDTTDAGAGVQVFQPLEITAGADALSRIPVVKDGDTQIGLALRGLEAGQVVSFTIDVDDTLRHSARGQTQITGAEIAGGTVFLQANGAHKAMAVFDNTNTARLSVSDCVS